MGNNIIWGVWITLLLGACQRLPESVAEHMSALPEEISYNFHIKPILSDRCFSCHGPDAGKREAGLRLDQPEAAYAALADHPGKRAITPGSLSGSEVYHRILTEDPELVMPPPESKLSLTEREKALILAWIDQGAPYEPHWSFQPILKPEVPDHAGSNWALGEVDHFIAQKLLDHGLEPSPLADKRTLARRVALGLTGLPPDPAVLRAYLEDTNAGAYDTLVERLLSSPTYGERMAAMWMDIARYADSDGYLDDKHRDFSPWRDWVIDAFNRNLSYQDFVTWQLAGDLLPQADQETVLATAFNRLHKKNSEAGIVFEEYRVEYVADRTHTFSTAFLGLTMECARCHDHKYDPISQEDYYRLFAFFNSTDEIGTPVYGPDQTPGPALLLATPEQRMEIDALKERIDRLEGMEEQYASAPAAVKAWIAATDLRQTVAESYTSARVAMHDFDHLSLVDDPLWQSPNQADPAKPARVHEPVIDEGYRGNAFFVSDYNTVTLGDKVGWYERTEPFSVSLWLHPPKNYPEAGIFTHCEDFRLGYKGYSLHLENNRLRFIMAHSWPQNAVEIITLDSLPIGDWSQVAVTYDGSSTAAGVSIFLNGEQLEVEVRRDNLYKGILFEPDIHTYGFRGFTLGYRDKVIPFKGGGIDELQVFDRMLTPLEVGYGYQTGRDPFMDGPGLANELKEYYDATQDRRRSEWLAELQQERQQLNSLMNEIPEIMVMGDLPQPRPTFVLERGQYDAPGKAVSPDVPEVVLAAKDANNRLDLANWLFRPDHPLTARVMVNRLWQMHFGRGLVGTAEDFGAQGELPSHPELLDWLAATFMELNWDIKAMHRLIVTTAVYRHSSEPQPQHLERDPTNRWLARAPRPRLEAEMMRDQALAVSGLLVSQVGGQSVYPYQPDGLWDELSNKSWRYPYLQVPGDGLYRRSLYTIFKRTAPPPSMLIFDVPDRSTCTVHRVETSTPLQALVLLNDEQYLEAARVLAQAVMLAYPDETSMWISQVFERITCRPPDEDEHARLQAYFDTEYARYKQNPRSARELLSMGEASVPDQLSSAQLAALTLTCSSIFNTTEAQHRM